MSQILRRYISYTANQAAKAAAGNLNPHAANANYMFWKRLTFFVGVPAIVLCMVNAYLKHQEEHHKPRPEFIKYDYLCKREKPFPWGDGNKSLFHNPKVNFLPDGYET